MEINGTGTEERIGEGMRWNNYSQPFELVPHSHVEEIGGLNQMLSGQLITYAPDWISVPTVPVPVSYQPGCTQYSLVYPALICESQNNNSAPNVSQAYQTPHNDNRFYTQFSQNFDNGAYETKNICSSPLVQLPSNDSTFVRNNHNYVESGYMSNSRFIRAGIPSFSFSVNFPMFKTNEVFEPVQTRNSEESRCGETELILKKELTKSDVGSVGRVVLPKKDAEAKMPPLFHSEGIIICMDDMAFPVTWKFKYRFWPNNKSRMYILENAGEFVKSHGLEAGDFLSIHKNTLYSNYFVKGEKKIRPTNKV